MVLDGLGDQHAEYTGMNSHSKLCNALHGLIYGNSIENGTSTRE